MVRFGFAAATVVVSLGSAGCFQPLQNAGLATPAAQQADNPERPLELTSPIRSGANMDAVVRLVAGGVTCSGTLIGDDLVLTAHHCVSERNASGRVLEQDVAPEDVSVELGGSHLPWGEVGVRAIVSPDCGYERGAGDIAILVLTRKLVGVPTFSPRMDTPPPPKGEMVLPWGYGRCALSRDSVHLVAREGGAVDSVYRDEFLGQAGICPGDSGGPALTVNNEVVGIISTSVMDHDESTKGVTHYTRLDAWRGLFAAAREISNGASSSELPPYRSCSQ
jgi:hypothetical protein